MGLYTYSSTYRLITGNTSAALLLHYLANRCQDKPFIDNTLPKELGWTSAELKRTLKLLGRVGTLTDGFPETPLTFNAKGVFLASDQFIIHGKEGKDNWYHVNGKLLDEILDCTSNGKWRKYMKADSGKGYVYIIETPNGYKIGQSKTVLSRSSSVLRAIPTGGKVAHLIPTIDRTGLEAKLHNRYNGKRIKGEWFELTPEDVEELKKETFE